MSKKKTMCHPSYNGKPSLDLREDLSGARAERARKVERLRPALEEGTYFVLAEAIAEKIIRYYTSRN